jgi:hypothetical protein
LNNVVNFLNTLFGIEVAIFGIISAVVLVFIQLVYSNFSYKHINQLIRNKFLILYFIFSAIDLLFTSIGSFLLSFTSQGFFPKVLALVITFVLNPYYSLICLLLIFISISFFLTLIIKNIAYLQPHRAVFLLAKNIKYDDIRNYILKKYKIEPPFSLRFKFDISGLDDRENPKETEEERIAEQKKKDEEDNKKLEAIEKQIDLIKKRTAHSEDPIQPIRDMMIQFIKRADLNSLTDAREILISISNEFITKVPVHEKEIWSLDSELIKNYSMHFIELSAILLEVADKEGLESARKILLETVFEYGQILILKNHFSEFNIIQKFLEKISDASINNSPSIFQAIMNFYQSIGDLIFDSFGKKPDLERNDERKNVLDALFRSIGWLGERLLTKISLEDSLLINNFDNTTEYDTYFNCLLSFSYRYDREQPRQYPQIYFASLYVVLHKLVQIYKKDKTINLGENIFTIAYAFASFANSAIIAGNSDGASLAVIRLKDAYDDLKENDLKKDADDVLRLFVRIGILAAGNKEKLHMVDFLSGPLDEQVADILVSSGTAIDKEVLDSYLHTYEVLNHDASWEFITKLGMRMGTNFGLGFDPNTGLRYPEHDHRS